MSSNVAQQSDAEQGTMPNERAPLLDNQDRRSSDEAAPEEVEAEAKRWPYYAWKGFWAVLAILVLAAFIKGWVDAGDTHVSREV